MSHSVLHTDRAEVEATFRLLEEENRNNPHIVNGMMAPRYLSYDMEKGFDDQFQANAAKLIDALDHLPSIPEVRGND